MTQVPATLENNFRAVLRADQMRSASPSDVVSGVQPQLILEPATEQHPAAALRLSSEARLAVIPRGGATKLAWGNSPSRADLILSTTRLNRVLEHAWADLTVTVEAGCTFQTLQETLAQHGQRLALDPLWPEKATVGGILSTNDSGALRLRFGSLRDLIIGVTIALPDGTLASSGGKVVKNVAGYDLPKLVTGALGTLGVITRAVFRLHPLPRNTVSLSIPTPHVDETQRFVHAVQDSKLAHAALQSRFSGATQPISDILFEGTEVGLAAQETQLRNLSGLPSLSKTPASVWTARQDLWGFSDPESTAIAKVTILPANLARMIGLFERTANGSQLRWRVLVYATGIGWLRLQGAIEPLHRALSVLRRDLEGQGGSLVLLHRPEKMPEFDAWGY